MYEERWTFFSITTDEWTSKRSRRYLNVNIHHFEKDFNLGLAPIASFGDAKAKLKLASEKLKIFSFVSSN